MPNRQSSGQDTHHVAELVSRLETHYGPWDRGVEFDPTEELVACILSQHTTDATSFPAFAELRATFPSWEQVVAAGTERVAQVVRGAGLANSKSRNIVASLQQIERLTGGYSLDFLRAMPVLEARDWLMALPGVGPKTASIVLCFALGMPAVPVDTHVYRVSWRLGLIPEGVGENKAHDLLLETIPPEWAYRFHMALVRHGRVTCRAPLPWCPCCPVTDRCEYFKQGRPSKAKPPTRGAAS